MGYVGDVGPERARLGFPDEVERVFHFLEQDYGFERGERQSTFVQYLGPGGVFVNVYHGRASYEVGVEIGLGAPIPSTQPSVLRRLFGRGPRSKTPTVMSGEKFSLSNVVGAVEERYPPPDLTLVAESRESIRQHLDTFQSLVRQDGPRLLRGDSEAFRKVREYSDMRNKEYTKQVLLRQLPKELAEQWRPLPYEEISRLYADWERSNVRPVTPT